MTQQAIPVKVLILLLVSNNLVLEIEEQIDL